MKTTLVLLIALCATTFCSYYHQQNVTGERTDIVRAQYSNAIDVYGVERNGYTKERATVSAPTDFRVCREGMPSIIVRVIGKTTCVVDDGI